MRVPEYFLQFVDGAVCRYSLQDSAASLLTFRALSIMSNEVFGCCVESQLIWLLGACVTEKVGWLNTEPS